MSRKSFALLLMLVFGGAAAGIAVVVGRSQGEHDPVTQTSAPEKTPNERRTPETSLPRFNRPADPAPPTAPATVAPSADHGSRAEAARQRIADRAFKKDTSAQESQILRLAARRAGLTEEEEAKVVEMRAKLDATRAANENRHPSEALSRSVQAQKAATEQMRALLGPERYARYARELVRARMAVGAQTHAQNPRGP